MLVYHPANDAYHCVFRLLSILEQRASLEVDHLRILDFVLCFPSVVAGFRFPQNLAAIKRQAKNNSNLYRTPINPKGMFLNLRPTHDGALACLASAGFIVSSELQHGRAVRTANMLPLEMARRCDIYHKSEVVFFNTLLPVLVEIPLYGESGLKDRSGLMEFRYDNV